MGRGLPFQAAHTLRGSVMARRRGWQTPGQGSDQTPTRALNAQSPQAPRRLLRTACQRTGIASSSLHLPAATVSMRRSQCLVRCRGSPAARAPPPLWGAQPRRAPHDGTAVAAAAALPATRQGRWPGPRRPMVWRAVCTPTLPRATSAMAGVLGTAALFAAWSLGRFWGDAGIG